MINRNELRQRRIELFQTADALVQSAKKSGTDLAGNNLEKFHACIGEMKEIDGQIERLRASVPNLPIEWDTPFPALPNNSGPQIPVAGMHNVNGRGKRIFAKGESIEAYVRQQHGGEDGITLGELARAMVVGGGRPEIRAALAEGSDSSGGVTVPVVLSSQIIDALRARSTVFAAGAKTYMLDTAKTTIATIASDPVATWRAENAAVNASDMTFGSVIFQPKTLAVITTASKELLEDSVNLDQALLMSLSAAFAVELDRVALIGAGTGSEPKGCSKVAGVGSVSMGTNGAALTNYDPFVQALGTLRTANAADPTAVIMHPRSEQELNLLKDSQNRPLDRPKALENLPFMVTSKLSITETQGSANTASRAIMGNFAELIVGVRHYLTIEVLRERYADSLQYGFLAFLRSDIAVAHAASFCNVVGIL